MGSFVCFWQKAVPLVQAAGLMVLLQNMQTQSIQVKTCDQLSHPDQQCGADSAPVPGVIEQDIDQPQLIYLTAEIEPSDRGAVVLHDKKIAVRVLSDIVAVLQCELAIAKSPPGRLRPWHGGDLIGPGLRVNILQKGKVGVFCAA